jgi:hypothetical protein
MADDTGRYQGYVMALWNHRAVARTPTLDLLCSNATSPKSGSRRASALLDLKVAFLQLLASPVQAGE